MRFADAQYFWFLLLVPALVLFYLAAFRKKKKALARFARVKMMEKLTQHTSAGRQYLKAMLILLVFLFAALSLTRPQYGTKMELIQRQGLDIVIAVDVSNSMLAEDIKPNRISRAKYEISNFIENLKGDRVGLVGFAGDAFVLCPLTVDYSAARIFLDVLDPELMEVQGTNISAAMEKSLKSFDQTERKYRVMVLLTDGEDHSGQAEKWAEEASKQGVVIYTVGIGSSQGVPIPIKDERGNVSYKKDRRGNVVSTRLDEVTLQKMALATGGKYYQAAPGHFELEGVLKEISNMEKREMEGELYTQYEERFQIPLLLALAILLFEMLLSDKRRQKKAWTGRFLN